MDYGKEGDFGMAFFVIGSEYCIAERSLVEIAYVICLAKFAEPCEGGFRELGFSIRTEKSFFVVAYGVGLRSDR